MTDAEVLGSEVRGGRKEELAYRLEKVRDRIRAVGSAELLPVTKFHPADDIGILAELGVRRVGENRVQEAEMKADYIASLHVSSTSSLAAPQVPVAIDIIGQIQRKKANAVARCAARVHTVDSQELAQALSRGVDLAYERQQRQTPLEVLIQWSVDGDSHRGGVREEDIDSLADYISGLSGLDLVGLMVIPPLQENPARVFERGYQLFESLRDRLRGSEIYSAGMSADLEAAIMAGSNLVRVGTDIMGPRPVA